MTKRPFLRLSLLVLALGLFYGGLDLAGAAPGASGPPTQTVVVGNTADNPVPVQQQGTATVSLGNATVPVHEQGTVEAAQSGTWHVSLDGTPGVTSADQTQVVGKLGQDLAASSNYTVAAQDILWAKSVRVMARCEAGSACSNVKVSVRVTDSPLNSAGSVYDIDEFTLPTNGSTVTHVYDDLGQVLLVTVANDNSSPASNIAVAVLARAN